MENEKVLVLDEIEAKTLERKKERKWNLKRNSIYPGQKNLIIGSKCRKNLPIEW